MSNRSRSAGGIGSDCRSAAYLVRSGQVPAGSGVLPTQLRRNFSGSFAVADHAVVITADSETAHLHAAIRDHVESFPPLHFHRRSRQLLVNDRFRQLWEQCTSFPAET